MRKQPLMHLLLTVISFVLLVSCGNVPQEPPDSQQANADEQTSATSDAANPDSGPTGPSTEEPQAVRRHEADMGLEQILEQDNLQGSAGFLFYLLEHYDEGKLLPREETEGFPHRFQLILHLFERDGLHEPEMELLDCKPVDAIDLFGTEDIKNRNGQSLFFYDLHVRVKSGGPKKQLPEGEQRWLAGFIDDDYQYIDFILPYDSAVERLGLPIRYPDEVARARDDAFVLREPFTHPSEIPLDHLVYYILWYGKEHSSIERDGYYGTTMTQEQLDASARQLLNIEHVDATTSSLYEEELGLYYLAVGGFGGPTENDIVGVDKENGITHVYHDPAAFRTDYLLAEEGISTRRIMKYTYRDGILQSAQLADASKFASLILSGENG